MDSWIGNGRSSCGGCDNAIQLVNAIGAILRAVCKCLRDSSVLLMDFMFYSEDSFYIPHTHNDWMQIPSPQEKSFAVGHLNIIASPQLISSAPSGQSRSPSTVQPKYSNDWRVHIGNFTHRTATFEGCTYDHCSGTHWHRSWHWHNFARRCHRCSRGCRYTVTLCTICTKSYYVCD